ncbi:nuclear pore complex protein Nup214-like [Phoenix dactylifera]|uniref:Nuclear pore complex protein Nup214-like n=1 Tax=Phoenix dactylifera TaxID=42345 RepID=A0A8B7C1R3_PHODC|nr:nuclear pore complex protein Nup214-like [Phoenix dactylifera]
MNSFTGNSSQRGPSSSAAFGASFDSYSFDFGVAAGRSSTSRPLRDQKPNPSPAPYAAAPLPTAPFTHQPARPSWTHQPASAVPRSGIADPPSSMVGDISGKSWTSAAPTTSRLGIPENNPNLFSDLVGSALGQGRSAAGNVPLKAAAPSNAFSTENLSNSLPKSTVTTARASTTSHNTPTRPSNWGSADNLGIFSSLNQSGSKIGNPLGGGQPMNSSAGEPPMNAKRDPFGSLMDFGSKNSSNQPMSSAKSSYLSSSSGDDYSFGTFQNASSTKMDDFGVPAENFSAPPLSQQPAPAKGGADPMDMFFSSSASSASAAGAASEVPGRQPFSEANDWDLGAEFGGHDDGGTTTELEGLPPPPAGVTPSAAKTKGLENYKQGQFADAIKWLSWAAVLIEKSGENDAATEVLSCRASCYKEVGEYKKAIADCSKVLEHDSTNVSVLLQRALLYESSEKYRLGAEDLQMVLKIDPGNRLARSTIHRLSKLAD